MPKDYNHAHAPHREVCSCQALANASVVPPSVTSAVTDRDFVRYISHFSVSRDMEK